MIIFICNFYDVYRSENKILHSNLIGAIERELGLNNKIFDGIYEIKFNKDLECIYFKSWEIFKESNI